MDDLNIIFDFKSKFLPNHIVQIDDLSQNFDLSIVLDHLWDDQSYTPVQISFFRIIIIITESIITDP